MSQEKNNLMLDMSGVSKLHSLGLSGKGIKILCLENMNDADGHYEVTVKCAKVSSPDSEILAVQNDNVAWDKAISEKWDIVNISMTMFDYEKSLEYVNQGGIVVCATGNNDQSKFVWWPHVIDVGAQLENGLVATYSAKGTELDLVTYVPYIQGSSGNWFKPMGTSFSSPFCAGSIACLIQYWKSIKYKYDGYKVRQYLLNHAEDIYTEGYDTTSGYGSMRVNTMKVIDIPINENKIIVDGETKLLDVGGIIVNGRTVIPARALAESLGCSVEWLPTESKYGTARIFAE
jgi:hypothetical protein